MTDPERGQVVAAAAEVYEDALRAPFALGEPDVVVELIESDLDDVGSNALMERPGSSPSRHGSTPTSASGHSPR